MYSFYGGPPGKSIEIVKTYSSYNSLVTDFAKTDCEVRTNQCASIISTSDSKNGNIYLRNSYGLPKLIGSFSEVIQPNFIEEIAVTNNNDLLVRYKGIQLGSEQYNNKTWQNLGNITTTNTFTNNSIIENIEWYGVGKVEKSTRQTAFNFIIPFIYTLGKGISNVQFYNNNSGKITIQKNGIVIKEINLSSLDENLKSIRINELGIKFKITINEIINDLANNQLINILFQGFSLKFI